MEHYTVQSNGDIVDRDGDVIGNKNTHIDWSIMERKAEDRYKEWARNTLSEKTFQKMYPNG